MDSGYNGGHPGHHESEVRAPVLARSLYRPRREAFQASERPGKDLASARNLISEGFVWWDNGIIKIAS